MRLFFGLFLIVFFSSFAHAQNFNAMSTFPQNKMQWDGPTAQAWEESSITTTWSVGFAAEGSNEQCTLIGWYKSTAGSSYSPPMHTLEMDADAHCIFPPNPGTEVLAPYARYEVYTCDAGYRWGVMSNEPSVQGCFSGYYVAGLGDSAANGQCPCQQGRAATPHPIEIGTGNMSESATDFASGDGRLRVDRYYNSNPQNPGVGGTGWKNAFLARHISSVDAGLKPPPTGSSAAPSTASVIYSSAADACAAGVAGLAKINPAYAGLTGTSSGGGQCTLSNGAALPIFNTNSALAYSSSIADAVSGVTVFRPDGSNYYFTCNNGACTSVGQSEVTLVATSAGYALTAENGDVETYDLSGNLLQIVSRDGYTQTLNYNTSGTISTVTDSYGKQLTFAYNTYGELSQLTLPDQTLVQYGYDLPNRLISVTYADRSVVRYQYANTNFPQALTAWIDESNAAYATWSYDNTTGMATASALGGNVDTSALTYGNNSTTLTDNLGTQRTYSYQDAAGGLRLTSISGPMCSDCVGQSMTYDANGFLKSSLDWNGNTTGYSYGPTGLLLQRIDGAGSAAQRTVQTTWNTALRVPLQRTVSNASGTTVANTGWAYNTSGEPLARCEIDPAQASGYTCAATGTVPAGVRRWTYTYCTTAGSQCPIVGLLLSITGPRTDLTQTTTYNYYTSSSASGCGTPGAACYQAGDLYQVTDALGHVTTVASYDANGRITRLTDANGINTDLTYTLRGRLASRTIGGAATSFTYMPYGAVATITDADNVTTTYTYDAAHRLTKIMDVLGNYVQYTLDAAGNVTQQQTFDSGGTVHTSLSRTFNALGQLTTVLDGINQTVFSAAASGSYDGNGNLLNSADALGYQLHQGFDALNRLTGTIANYNGTDSATANITTTAHLDALDRLTSVTDPTALTTNYSYDGLSDHTQLQSPDTGTSTDTYDAAGDRLTHTDAKGVVSTSTYDADNRPVSTSYANTALNVTYTYDEANSATGCSTSNPIGRLTRVVEGTVTTVFCYDGRGNVIQKMQLMSGATDITNYGYTAANRLTGESTPDQTAISYTHDGDGRVSGVQVTPSGATTAPPTVVSAISYLPFGPISTYTLGNGQIITRTYDANYRLTDLTSPAFNLHFARDAMGDITALGNAPGANPATETYNYDPLYRLTGITDTGAALETYTYNPTGDRLSKTAPGLATGTYLYTTGTHQIASIGNAAQANDADGNTTGSVIGGNTYGFGYNERNRLTVVQLNGQTVGNYTYSALGERIGKVASFPQAVTERYAYNEAGQLIGEYGTTNRDYIWLGGLPVAVVDNTINGSVTTSTVNYVTADQLGTPRVVTNSAGTVIWQLPYAGNPFGEHQPTSTTGYVLNLRFPGQYFDAESGLVHNGFRDYCPACGRYIQSDPVGLAAGMSTYAYTGSSPLNASDRLGLSCSAAGGTVTCAAPGGPTVSFPQPAGWPTTINSSSENYHAYDVPVSTGGADAGAITQQIINNPTPGSPSAATAGGTYNDATPTAFQDLSNFLDGIGDGAGGGYNNSPVMSYVTVDPATGNTVVVNVTLPGHPLFPGYVAREVCGGVVHNFGEGTSSLQSPSSPFANDINNVWIQQTQNLINNVSK